LPVACAVGSQQSVANLLDCALIETADRRDVKAMAASLDLLKATKALLRESKTADAAVDAKGRIPHEIINWPGDEAYLNATSFG
jgi:hypothetical protein